jgi:lysine-specific demethylase 3
VHTCNVKPKGWQKMEIQKIQKSFKEYEVKDSLQDPQVGLDEGKSSDISLDGQGVQNVCGAKLDANENKSVVDQGLETIDVEENDVNCEQSNRDGEDACENTHPGVLWDVFRRQDVPKLTEYLRIHWKEFGKPDCVLNDNVSSDLIILQNLLSFLIELM